jgi:hypothetical protein
LFPAAATLALAGAPEALPIFLEDWDEEDDDVRLWLCNDGARPSQEAILAAGIRAWTFLYVMAVNYMYIGCEATLWKQMRCPVQRSAPQLRICLQFSRNAAFFCEHKEPFVLGGWDQVAGSDRYG